MRFENFITQTRNVQMMIGEFAKWPDIKLLLHVKSLDEPDDGPSFLQGTHHNVVIRFIEFERNHSGHA